MFQAPFHVSLVAFSFQKFHFPLKKNYPNPRTQTDHRSLTTGQAHQHKIEIIHTNSSLRGMLIVLATMNPNALTSGNVRY